MKKSIPNSRLKILRESRGVIARKTAELLKVSYASYLNYENGVNDIPAKVLKEASELYEVSIDYILMCPERRPSAFRSLRDSIEVEDHPSQYRAGKEPRTSPTLGGEVSFDVAYAEVLNNSDIEDINIFIGYLVWKRRNFINGVSFPEGN